MSAYECEVVDLVRAVRSVLAELGETNVEDGVSMDVYNQLVNAVDAFGGVGEE